MLRAVDLLRQGRNEELWQMCCGFLYLNLEEFMTIQRNLLLQQLQLLNNSPFGKKILRGIAPQTVEEFRQLVPLTTYSDYCPELLDKREDVLPSKPEMWTHSSGWSGEYSCKWVPISNDYAIELSKILFGIGILSCCKDWGDIPRVPHTLKLLYSVAPRPYVSGTLADLLRLQIPLKYLPNLEEAETLPYEERIATGLRQALDKGMDYFFGLSLVLVKVGEKIRDSSGKVDIRKYLTRPRALLRLAKALIKSRIANRPMLPKDLWSLRGIIGSGVDSTVFKKKIKELWGKNPLDIYSCTEGGVIATQTWDYEGMTFVPSLNFLEFIPEDELIKWQLDRSYKMRTLLLDEVEPGESYEIVISNFHGGSLVRYRIGDMVTITSLRNDRLGIDIPQMVFERRVDDIIDFVFIRLTEKTIWQVIERTGVPYNDWIAFRDSGDAVLHIFIESCKGVSVNEADLSQAIFNELTRSDDKANTLIPAEYAEMMDFRVEVTLLPEGIFDKYTSRKQVEGSDLAHFKPPHINPSPKVLSTLLGDTMETIVVSKTGSKSQNKSESAGTTTGS
ncbi:MAG: GH3 auxin-responsive promoter family protein [Dehalococcoidales bacterium]|nr:GH3 auxin-responsive promoter family protein [Dehalococcoidales bacterium]